MQLIVFTLDNLYYALPTEFVEEITNRLSCTAVPKSSGWVKGLINLRGDVMTLVNIHNLLNMNEFEAKACYNNTIIVQINENKMALMVDKVIGVKEVNENEFQPSPHPDGHAIVSLVTAYDQVVNVIELTNLFNENEGFK